MAGKRIINGIVMLLAGLIFLHGCGKRFAEIEDLKITVKKGTNRQVIFTNRNQAFILTNTHAFNRNAYYGITFRKNKLLQDYLLLFDGNLLIRDSCRVEVYPDRLVRYYPDYNTRETIFFADSLLMLSVSIETDFEGSIGILPVLPPWDYDLLKSVPEQGKFKVGNSYLSVFSSDLATYSPINNDTLFAYLFDGEVITRHSYRVKKHGKSLSFTLVWSQEGFPVPVFVDKWIERKRKRISQLLQRAPQLSEPEVDKALKWALIQLENMTNVYDGAGIWAGLPWFDDYWGRDTFISLAGAMLVTGHFQLARDIIQAFASLQVTDPQSRYYGRIPNRVNPESISYNSADGTPLFVKAIQEYLQYTGDLAFLSEIYPVVYRSIEGTLKYHTDEEGFLVHGDAETWMDAVGVSGPWSPRGNRAVEIQSLWARQLQIGCQLAERLGKSEDLKRWKTVLQKLTTSFQQRYLQSGRGISVDHLNSDGTADLKKRPNRLLAAFWAPEELISSEDYYRTLYYTMKECIYPYGVATLNQIDPDFHWYHIAPGHYPKDEAYHNGTVWQWLSGAAVSSLLRFQKDDLAWILTKSLAKECLDSAAVGTIAELRDALPQYGRKVFNSGALSQTWSLAEFVRPIYQDYMGLKPDLLHDKVLFAPSFPSDLQKASFPVFLGGNSLKITYTSENGQQRILIERSEGNDSLRFQFQFYHKNKAYLSQEYLLTPRDRRLEVEFEPESEIIKVNRGKVTPEIVSIKIPQNLANIEFQTPGYDTHLKSTRLPDYPLLSYRGVLYENPEAKMAIDVQDSIEDDKGWNGRFTYPRKGYFQQGIFDLTRLRISYDPSMVYFRVSLRNLVQPGWHPEYGFQLTFLAICIDTDGLTSSKEVNIGRNLGVTLPPEFGIDRIIFVGGGFSVQDEKGQTLCRYLPVKPEHAFADLDSRLIRFAVPVKYLPGKPEEWRIILFAGAQDDHGGDDIGEFRSVLPGAKPWNGGGNIPDGPNFYDLLTYPRELEKLIIDRLP